jgi:hypothetical protein
MSSLGQKVQDVRPNQRLRERCPDPDETGGQKVLPDPAGSLVATIHHKGTDLFLLYKVTDFGGKAVEYG